MTKASFASAIALLLGLPAIATAGSLNWGLAGSYPTKNGCQPISFDQPDAIAVDQSDDIYIANEAGPSAVQELAAGGTETIRTVLSRSIEPIKSGHYFGLSLAFGPKGALYLAVKDRGTVERLNANGTLTVVAGKPGNRELVDGPASKARLKAPNAIAIGPHGTIYVADTRTIRKIEPDGSVTTLAGNPYATNPHPVEGGAPWYRDRRGRHAVFMSPNGIAVDGHGNLFSADGYAGEDEGQADDVGVIRKIARDGTVSTLAGSILFNGDDLDGVGANANFGDNIFGIALDRDGDIYITEPMAPSIRRVDSDGRVDTVIKAEGPGNDRSTGLINPTGIAVDSRGAIFVVDNYAIEPVPAEPVDWLHRFVGGRLETLCKEGAAVK